MLDLLSGDRHALLTIASGFSVLVGLGLNIALLVVALGTVRRARKSASGLIAVYAAGGIVTTCIWPMIPMLTQRLADTGGPEWSTMMALQQMVMTVIHAGLVALLIAAIVQLARPPSRDPRDPDPTP